MTVDFMGADNKGQTSPASMVDLPRHHRFTLTVIACFAAMIFSEPPAFVVYSPLLPLFLLLLSGLYMFLPCPI